MLTGPDQPAPAPGAQHTGALQKKKKEKRGGGLLFAGRTSATTGPNPHRGGYRVTAVTRVLSVEALHPPLKHFNCIWCTCFQKSGLFITEQKAFSIYSNRATSGIKYITHIRTLDKLLITHSIR